MDRNLILAIVLSMAIIFGYQSLIAGPKQKAWREAEAARQAAAEEAGLVSPTGTVSDPTSSGTVTAISREDALESAPGRILIRTDELQGSINLQGLVFDDLQLRQYPLTLADDSPPMTLLSPTTSSAAQYMRAGLTINEQADRNIVWKAPEGSVLGVDQPVTLTRMQDGIEHEVVISIDEHFMFTVTQTVRNKTNGAAKVQTYGAAYQNGIPTTLKNMMMLYEGPLGVVDHKLHARKYKNVVKKGGIRESGTGGWVGLTDKYTLSAAIPPQDIPFRADITAGDGVTPIFRSTYLLDPVVVAAGSEFTQTSYLYGGVKEVKLLRQYEKELGVDRFDEAVDWGNILWILTRAIFAVLSFFHGLVGNWGVAILLLTLLVKAILFPLANMSYKSMAGMKMVQPELKKVQERYKDDKVKLQQEMMALYKKHKINPAAGCLPILAQMPIFFALYKTLFVTTELRHEPFLYIRDLSERDPTSIFNLFGLLPYDPLAVPVIGNFLGLGILPLLMGAAMYVQTKLNPPPTDDTQRLIFGLMPLIFMFIFAPFAAGLVLYWFWNTFLGVVQQYVIMKRQGADVDILGNIKTSFGKKEKTPANENKAD